MQGHLDATSVPMLTDMSTFSVSDDISELLFHFVNISVLTAASHDDEDDRDHEPSGG